MWLELLGMLVCFGMVGTIASQASYEENEDSDSNKEKLYGIFASLVSAIFMAVVAVANRYLKDYPAPVVGFHFTVLGFFMTLIYIAFEAVIT